MIWFKSIDSVLKSFNKNITDLEALSARHANKAETYEELVKAANAKKIKHEEDAGRAIAVANKLRALIA